MPGGKGDVVSCRHARRNLSATSIAKGVSEKYRDEPTYRQNYARPRPAVQIGNSGSARGTVKEARSRLTRVNLPLYNATASCKVETENRSGTIAILEINRKFEASPLGLDSLE